jgi:hypothetical protein
MQDAESSIFEQYETSHDRNELFYGMAETKAGVRQS